MTMTTRKISKFLFKCTGRNGKAANGGKGYWHLPIWDVPGKWMPKLDEDGLNPCHYGYHLCSAIDIVAWRRKELYVAEWRGRIIKGADKYVVSEARLRRRIVMDQEMMARVFLPVVKRAKVRRTDAKVKAWLVDKLQAIIDRSSFAIEHPAVSPKINPVVYVVCDFAISDSFDLYLALYKIVSNPPLRRDFTRWAMKGLE
jgi:hypothetical protein